MKKQAWVGVVVVCVGLVRCVSGDDTSNPDSGGKDATNDLSVVDTSTNDTSTVDVNCNVAPTTTFYVDGTTGSDSNTGAGPTCAFKSITAALNASKTAYNATISVAAGTYGANETFPLVLNAGRSLVGAGMANTTIKGSPTTGYSTTGTGSPFDGTDGLPDGGTTKYFPTLIAGDGIGGANSLGATTISNISILPSVNAPTTAYVGVACVVGNGPNTGTTPPLPAANLVMKSTTVGPNFDIALMIGSSPTLGLACNVSVITSTFTGSNVGITTGTCGTANPSSSWPSAAIGDGNKTDANTFTSDGIGIFGEGCGSVQSYNANKFVSGFRGIVMVSQAVQYFEILSNTFDGTTAPNMGIGVQTNASAVITKMNDNTFTNISESSAADTAVGGAGSTGYAIGLGGPHVLQAQRNIIANNDNGVTIGGGSTANFDFSSGGSMVNANQFYCNSKTLAGTGYDLIITGGTPNFSGNIWDHGSPTTGTTTAAANGTDVINQSGGTANTTSPGQANTSTCATGRVH